MQSSKTVRQWPPRETQAIFFGPMGETVYIALVTIGSLIVISTHEQTGLVESTF